MSNRGGTASGPSFSNGPDGNELTAAENELWVGASDPRTMAMFGLT